MGAAGLPDGGEGPGAEGVRRSLNPRLNPWGWLAAAIVAPILTYVLHWPWV
jgi:hypothetical protein